MPASKVLLKIIVLSAFAFLFWESRTIEKFVFTLIAIPSFAFGYFVFQFPVKVIEMQQQFYALINWKIEPISMSKEIRNTKSMGIILMAVVFLSAIYLFFISS